MQLYRVYSVTQLAPAKLEESLVSFIHACCCQQRPNLFAHRTVVQFTIIGLRVFLFLRKEVFAARMVVAVDSD